MGKLLVIGSLNMDLVLRVPRLPVPGETVLGHELHYACGGKGANQAYTLGKLGAQAVMLGSVGTDENGDKLLANLRAVNVNVDSIQRLTKIPSGLAVIGVEDSGNNNIIVVPGANLHTTSDYLDSQVHTIALADTIIMQLEIPMECVVRAARVAKGLKKTVILDPAPSAPLPHELYQYVDIIKPNEIELAHLSGLPAGNKDQAEKAARALMERGARTVVVTLGGEGALIVTEGEAMHVPADSSIKPADTTAAGDSFTAAMAMLLTEGHSLEESVKFASRVAAIVVSRPGAQSSIPDASEVAHLRP